MIGTVIIFSLFIWFLLNFLFSSILNYLNCVIVERQPAINAIVADTIKNIVKPIVYFRLPIDGNSEGKENRLRAEVDNICNFKNLHLQLILHSNKYIFTPNTPVGNNLSFLH